MKKTYDHVVTVTGAAGFVGSNLVRDLLDSDRDVLVFGADREYNTRLDDVIAHDDFVFEEYDVGQPLHSDFIAVDTFYHLAGIANPHVYLERPIDVMDLNLDGTRNILERASHWTRGRPRMVFSSTSEVYGKSVQVPFDEEDEMILGTARRWCYAASKLTAEHYIRAYAEKGINHTIFRFFNVVGPDIDSLGQGRVLTSFVGSALEEGVIKVVLPGTQTRCFTWINDATDALARVAWNKFDVPGFRDENHTLNLGSNDEVSMFDLAGEVHSIMTEMGHDIKIELVTPEGFYGKGYEDVERRVPNVQRIKDVLGWEATTKRAEFLPVIVERLIKDYEVKT